MGTPRKLANLYRSCTAIGESKSHLTIPMALSRSFDDQFPKCRLSILIQFGLFTRFGDYSLNWISAANCVQ